MVLLYDHQTKKIKDFSSDEVLDKLYYLQASVPSKAQLKGFKQKPDEIIAIISQLNNKVPLYDPFTENLYLIDKMNVYHRVVRLHYRFPDALLLEQVEKRMKDLEKETKKSTLQERRLRKYRLILQFMNQFDLNLLRETYIKVFYFYANEVGKNLTVCRRPSFRPEFAHITPYYSRSEMINLALNMGLIVKDNTFYTEEKLAKLCEKIKKNDISSSTLLQHQKYISKVDRIGLVQYYTLQGSFFMNQYLRQTTGYAHQNEELERLIKMMYRLLHEAPPFDQSYILYRFIKDDPHLRDLKPGEIYTANSFVSTTRDPFYRSDEFVFGFILLKITIPKGTPGVGLCLENYSHFPDEQEIVLPPGTELKLINKDKNCDYYHIDDNFQSQIKSRYEFQLVGHTELELPERPKADLKEVDFLKLISPEVVSMEERIRKFIQGYVNQSYQIKSKIGEKTFTLFLEWYNSSGVYRDFYAAKTEHGFAIYAFYQSNVLFSLEIGEEDETPYMYINHYFKYSSMGKESPVKQSDLLNFWASVAYYFRIPQTRIFSDYRSCDQQTTPREGGNYSVDYYDYLKTGTKRFQDLGLKRHEFREGFDYFLLDRLKSVSPVKILRALDQDELYQVYRKLYPETEPDNLQAFYVYIVENHCFLIGQLIKKMWRLYRTDNPFERDYYIFYPMTYLYNRSLIPFLPETNNSGDEETEPYLRPILPKNRYRENQRARGR